MHLQSKDWFLDFEVMIKAKQMGLEVFEMNVFSQSRIETGSSPKLAICLEFIFNLLKYRFGKQPKEMYVKPLDLQSMNKSHRD